MKLRNVLTLLAVLIFLAACGSAPVEMAEEPVAEEATEALEPTAEEMEAEEEASTQFVVEDDLGRLITLDAPPTSIISTAPSITESLFAIGAGDLLIGRDDFSVYPEAALDIPSVGSFFGELPVETLVGMEPDLVILAEIFTADHVAQLEDLGLTVYWQANPLDFDGLYNNLEDLGAITGLEAEAAAVVADLNSRVTAVEEAVSYAETSPVVFYELDGTDPQNPWTSGADTFIDLIMQTAGGQNAAAELQGAYAQMSAEALIAVNPDVIILGDADFGMTAEMVAERAGWDAMSAVQNGAIYPIDSNTMSVPGPRIVDGLESVAGFLFPDMMSE